MPIQANKKYYFPIVERRIRETNEFVGSEHKYRVVSTANESKYQAKNH
jgi:hypothetical protein